MAVHVRCDLSRMQRMLSSENMERARGTLTSQIAEDDKTYVPVDTGTLRDTMEVDVGEGKIVWVQEYANEVYNRDHVISAGNKNGTPHWHLTGEQNHLSEWEKVASDAILDGLL